MVETAARLLRDGGSGGYTQPERLAWLHARTALALSPRNATPARLVTLLAEEAYPYFLAWPQSRQALRRALGEEAVAGYTNRVREGHATSRAGLRGTAGATRPRCRHYHPAGCCCPSPRRCTSTT